MTSTECKLLELVDQHQAQYRRSWIGLLTAPNKEAAAFKWLTIISHRTPTEVYWPKKIVQAPAKVLPNGRRGRAPQARSIFPGMMFASIATDDIPGYRPFDDFKALAPLGLRGWLKNGQGYPSVLTEHDIITIMDIERRENNPEKPAGPRKFQIGDRVRFVDDLINAWPPGTITRLNSDGSLNIEVMLFGRMTKTVLGPQQVEAA